MGYQHLLFAVLWAAFSPACTFGLDGEFASSAGAELRVGTILWQDGDGDQIGYGNFRSDLETTELHIDVGDVQATLFFTDTRENVVSGGPVEVRLRNAAGQVTTETVWLESTELPSDSTSDLPLRYELRFSTVLSNENVDVSIRMDARTGYDC